MHRNTECSEVSMTGQM